MGLLIDGVWHDKWYDTKKSGGRFERQESMFRNWVTVDGSAGPDGEAGFKAEAGRYHLYVSLACPWAHRTLIFRKLKGLEEIIPISVVHWHMGKEGWVFAKGPGTIADSVNGADKLHQIYTKARPDYTGRATVPVLWDRLRETIVSNESAEIIRMFNTAFDRRTGFSVDFYPKHLRAEIDTMIEAVYHRVNNGVYECGFATAQEAYEEAFDALFATLDDLEQRLARQRYLLGDRLTEADWRLFTTLVRFDLAYHGHFKCNLRRLVDYPNLWGYARELYQLSGVAETVSLHHIKHHYYESHQTVNPSGIVPKGPAIDYAAPHDRQRLKAA